MVTIRLTRGGSKKRPFYHIHVADRRVARDGRFIERLGFFNPLSRGGDESTRIDLDRLEYWTKQGAQMSDRVTKVVKDYRRAVANSASEVAA
ncbi:MAG: small subunit ribosomal protein S16 [Candidatus Azotimanducaceae bacterium]|jgi:small subunit ribosomal protein S16